MAAAPAAAALLLCGCAVGPNFHSPAPPSNPHYTQDPQPTSTVEAPGALGAAQSFVSEAPIPADWWTLLGSASLNGLIADALRENPSLASAEATLRNAEASFAAARASLLPQIDAKADATRERAPGAAFGFPQAPPTVFTLYTASLSVAYRLDLFGGARRQLEAARAQADYQRYELEAARLTLAANIVTTAVNLASLRAQAAVVDELIAHDREQLAVAERQFQAGALSRTDVLAHRAQLAQTEAQLPALEKARAQTQHRLAVLAGRTPDVDVLPEFALEQLSLPRELPVSVPAQLVRQRPDVRAAEALLHAASAQVGVATANLLPTLNLTGSLGSDSVTAGNLLGPGTEAWSAGARLLQPIFHGGSLFYQRRAAVTAFEGAGAQYRATVLAAFEDVANSLRALEADARDLSAQSSSASAALGSLELIRRQYQAGGVSYVALLTAERQYLQARQARVQAEAARVADSAALFQSLGGGWWNRKENEQ